MYNDMISKKCNNITCNHLDLFANGTKIE